MTEHGQQALVVAALVGAGWVAVFAAACALLAVGRAVQLTALWVGRLVAAHPVRPRRVTVWAVDGCTARRPVASTSCPR
ncbi:MAG: hypothetical protein ACT4QG_09355 [Sporichthyaceae bacterium]